MYSTPHTHTHTHTTHTHTHTPHTHTHTHTPHTHSHTPHTHASTHTHAQELEALLPTRPDPPALDPEAEEVDMIESEGTR